MCLTGRINGFFVKKKIYFSCFVKISTKNIKKVLEAKVFLLLLCRIEIRALSDDVALWLLGFRFSDGCQII